MLKAEELGSALAMPISSFSLAAASPPQSLRMAFEEVSPRMEPFPGVAMEIHQVHPLLHGLQDSLHAETDRDRLILGSFFLQESEGNCNYPVLQGKFSSGGWQQ